MLNSRRPYLRGLRGRGSTPDLESLVEASLVPEASLNLAFRPIRLPVQRLVVVHVRVLGRSLQGPSRPPQTSRRIPEVGHPRSVGCLSLPKGSARNRSVPSVTYGGSLRRGRRELHGPLQASRLQESGSPVRWCPPWPPICETVGRPSPRPYSWMPFTDSEPSTVAACSW